MRISRRRSSKRCLPNLKTPRKIVPPESASLSRGVLGSWPTTDERHSIQSVPCKCADSCDKGARLSVVLAILVSVKRVGQCHSEA